jgi:hypothetical protein
MPVILAAWDVAIRRIKIQGQQGKQFERLNLNKSWAQWYMSIIPATWKHK